MENKYNDIAVFLSILLFIGLNIADAFLTQGLSKIEMGTELSPWMNGILHSEFIFSLVKVVLATVFSIVIWIFMKHPLRLMKALDIGMLAIVLWNLSWYNAAID